MAERRARNTGSIVIHYPPAYTTAHPWTYTTRGSPSVDPSTSGSIRAEIRCPTVQSVQPHSRDGARTIPKSTEPHPFKGPRPCLRFQTSPRQPRVDNPSARWAAGEQRAGGEARLRYIEPTANASYPPSPTFCATFPVEGHGALFGLDSMRWLRVGCGACAWLH